MKLQSYRKLPIISELHITGNPRPFSFCACKLTPAEQPESQRRASRPVERDAATQWMGGDGEAREIKGEQPVLQLQDGRHGSGGLDPHGDGEWEEMGVSKCGESSIRSGGGEEEGPPWHEINGREMRLCKIPSWWPET